MPRILSNLELRFTEVHPLNTGAQETALKKIRYSRGQVIWHKKNASLFSKDWRFFQIGLLLYLFS